jgi:hypothetical protein
MTAGTTLVKPPWSKSSAAMWNLLVPTASYRDRVSGPDNGLRTIQPRVSSAEHVLSARGDRLKETPLDQYAGRGCETLRTDADERYLTR